MDSVIKSNKKSWSLKFYKTVVHIKESWLIYLIIFIFNLGNVLILSDLLVFDNLQDFIYYNLTYIKSIHNSYY